MAEAQLRKLHAPRRRHKRIHSISIHGRLLTPKTQAGKEKFAGNGAKVNTCRKDTHIHARTFPRSVSHLVNTCRHAHIHTRIFPDQSFHQPITQFFICISCYVSHHISQSVSHTLCRISCTNSQSCYVRGGAFYSLLWVPGLHTYTNTVKIHHVNHSLTSLSIYSHLFSSQSVTPSVTLHIKTHPYNYPSLNPHDYPLS